MKARAPGKLVLSGAYGVLRGAPALVTAVDRFVYADAQLPSTFRTPEVQAAWDLLGQSDREHPFFDANELRADGRKLGLGSSAAILAASLYAADLPEGLVGSAVGHAGARLPRVHGADTASERQHIFALALHAHRTAQGGGSGVDVASSVFGGTLLAQLGEDEALEVTPVSLPALTISVWAMPSAASTAHFVRAVLGQKNVEQLLTAQIEASRQAATAARNGDGRGLIDALRLQHLALLQLGQNCSIPIVLPVVSALHARLPSHACFLPSGAGGGDVSIYFGAEPEPSDFESKAREAGLVKLALNISAPGARRL